MTWDYLVEGGYFILLFRQWYSLVGWLLYGPLWLLLFLLNIRALLIPTGVQPPVPAAAPTRRPWIPLRLQIAYHATYRLLTIENRRLGCLGINLIRLTCFIGFLYGIGLALITISPDWALTSGMLQSLSADDFQTAIYFLYRFALIGVFLTVLNLAASLWTAIHLFI